MLEAIAHYRILGRLGTGALGDVYRARDTRVGRTVAIRILPDAVTANPQKGRAVLDAARAALAVSHPNITALFEIGDEDGRRFLVSEFVQGDSLSALIDGRPLNLRRAVELAIQLADALAEAEASDAVHGDIRPGNIIVTSKERAKLMNFGLAPFTAGGASRRSESAPYVAPEELAGAPGDIRGDIFSLGAVLFEMLTGRKRGQGLAPSGMNRSVPPDLDRIVGRMLAGSPEERFQSAATVSAELRSVAAALETQATADEAAFELSRKRRKKGRAGTAVVFGIVAVLAIVAVWLWRSLAGQ